MSARALEDSAGIVTFVRWSDSHASWAALRNLFPRRWYRAGSNVREASGQERAGLCAP